MATWDTTNYGVDPWGDITQKERPWYDPVVRNMYYRKAVYSPHAAFQVDMNEQHARTIYFDEILASAPNLAPITEQQMEASRAYTDSYRRSVTTERYGNGFALHRSHKLFTYWNAARNSGNSQVLYPIIQQQMGQMIVDHIDLLCRNVMLKNPYNIFGAGSNFGGITNTAKLTTDLLDAVMLGMEDRVDYAAAVANNDTFTGDEIICITTPGVLYDLKREGTAPGFVDVWKYAQDANSPLISGKITKWRGFAFIATNMAKLYNSGTVAAQTTITAAVQPGDGAPDPSTTAVDGVRFVGQPGATHYIQVADASVFSVGDLVTVHQLRHNGTDDVYGVNTGPKMDDSMAQTMKIVSLNTTTDRLVFDKPYMRFSGAKKGLETDLGSGVYGYVTKALHVHTATFLPPAGRQQGVMCGVSQQPKIYTPPPIDDYESMFRFAYDMWMKFAIWEPRAYEVGFFTGGNRETGAVSHG